MMDERPGFEHQDASGLGRRAQEAMDKKGRGKTGARNNEVVFSLGHESKQLTVSMQSAECKGRVFPGRCCYQTRISLVIVVTAAIFGDPAKAQVLPFP